MMAIPIVVLFHLIVFSSAFFGAVGQQASFALGAIFFLAVILITVPFYAICVRRLHDVGMSGKHVLWMLPTGILGFGVLCFFFVEKGEPFANRFGPQPEGSDLASGPL